jgi:hypothetical protein
MRGGFMRRHFGLAFNQGSVCQEPGNLSVMVVTPKAVGGSVGLGF